MSKSIPIHQTGIEKLSNAQIGFSFIHDCYITLGINYLPNLAQDVLPGE